MRRNIVLDAGSLTLHFIEDPRVTDCFDKIDDGKVLAFMAGANLAEFYYKTCQKLGRQTADARYYQVKRSKIRVVDDELSRLAGLEKCRQALNLSLADCYALALAKKERAQLLTTDSELAKVKGISVMFLKV